MPLMQLDGLEALRQRKKNPHSTWGDRAHPNRVEPIAKPSFEIKFSIAPEEKIFTIGSCFARNIESELLRRGFKLPMRELFYQPGFLGMPLKTINNYATPSIYNELSWALDNRHYELNDHIVEVQPGKFLDLHGAQGISPESRDALATRRAIIKQAYHTILECRVIIITLGLAELWFDNQTRCYLNTIPLAAAIHKHPKRFSFHVLSYQEVYGFLEASIKLIQKHHTLNPKIILTISPIPLGNTFGAQDILVANSYTKSVLRAAVEEIRSNYSCVSYYPSFESITLSNRDITWKDDLRHVTDELIKINVTRMVDGYTHSHQLESQPAADPL